MTVPSWFIGGLMVLAGATILIGLIEHYRRRNEPEADSLKTLQQEWDAHVARQQRRTEQRLVQRRKGGA